MRPHHTLSQAHSPGSCTCYIHCCPCALTKAYKLQLLSIGPCSNCQACLESTTTECLVVCYRDRPSLPFRCLDPQYRRELVRVYLTNVEGICRRFVDEKRESLLHIKETAASFKAYWASQSPNDKKSLVQHKGSDMLKVGAGHCYVSLC